MRIALAIILAAFVFHAHAAVPKIVNNFATTNPPSTLSNIVQSLAGSPYASNVTSGGVLAQGTVSASTATAGYVLATTGTQRDWTNRITLQQIDPVSGYVRVTNTSEANFYTDIGNDGAITNVSPNGGGSIMLSNSAAAGTYTLMRSPSNGSNIKVLSINTNTVETSSITSAGVVTAVTVSGTTISGSSVTSANGITAGSLAPFNWASSKSRIYSPVNGQVSFVSNDDSTGVKVLFGGASTSANSAGSTNWPSLFPFSKTNGPGYALIQVMAGTNTTETASLAADMLMSTNKFTGAVAYSTNGNFLATGYMNPTNGVLWQGGAQLTNIYTATATLDFGNAATIGCSDLTITVTGAALGDVVDLGVPNASIVANSSFSAWVSAADTVTVRFCALISGDPASGVFRAEVHKWK